MMNQCI